MQTSVTHQMQSQTSSMGSNQIVTEDDLVGILDSIPWSSEDRDSFNLVNNHGQNLTHLCTQLGYHRLLVAVIERGAHTHTKDVNGWAALDLARLHHDEEATDILEGGWEESPNTHGSSAVASGSKDLSDNILYPLSTVTRERASSPWRLYLSSHSRKNMPLPMDPSSTISLAKDGFNVAEFVIRLARRDTPEMREFVDAIIALSFQITRAQDSLAIVQDYLMPFIKTDGPAGQAAAQRAVEIGMNERVQELHDHIASLKALFEEAQRDMNRWDLTTSHIGPFAKERRVGSLDDGRRKLVHLIERLDLGVKAIRESYIHLSDSVTAAAAKEAPTPGATTDTPADGTPVAPSPAPSTPAHGASPVSGPASLPKTASMETKPKRPIAGRLGLSSTTNPNLPQPLPSVLASARIIEDIDKVSYPPGIKAPKRELNVNAASGKFR
jgi:Eukaryotic translation initiation factor 4G1